MAAEQRGLLPVRRKDEQVLLVAEQLAAGRHILAHPQRPPTARIDGREMAKPLKTNILARDRSQQARPFVGLRQLILPLPGQVGQRHGECPQTGRLDARTHQVLGPQQARRAAAADTQRIDRHDFPTQHDQQQMTLGPRCTRLRW